MNIETYRRLLVVEKNIAHRGVLTIEDLMQMAEHRGWFFMALSKCLEVEPEDLKVFVSNGKVTAADVFLTLACAKLDEDFKPKLALLTQEVIYE